MSVQLSQQELTDLQQQGYTPAEINKALSEAEQEGSAVQSRPDPRFNSKTTSFAMGNNDDIIKWQLELNDILERAEHILRGDVVEFEEGNLVWKDNPHPETNALNNFGVKIIMKVLANYINRNTILSDYEQEEICYKVRDFGEKLNDLVFMKYEEMGMDTENKRKEYAMLIVMMVDIVHSAYKRALRGGERRSLREMISVNQSNSTNMQGTPQNPTGQQQTRGLLNPMRYVRGKYV